jgi:hypothetical protein
MKRPLPNYRAFTLKANGIANRIITEVKVSAAYDPVSGSAPPNLFGTTALWDTGATSSVITKATADALGLAPVGLVKVKHAGGESDQNSHIVNFYLPNLVAVSGVLVSECPDVDGTFGAIIGMDIIGRGDLSISNVKNQTWMSFRFPSTRAVDFVADFNRDVLASVGLNGPCPCGKLDISGRPMKYKICHMPHN